MNDEQKKGMEFMYDVIMQLAALQGLVMSDNIGNNIVSDNVDLLCDLVENNLAGSDMLSFFMLYSRPDGDKLRGVEVQIHLRPTDGSNFVSIDDPSEPQQGDLSDYLN